jgi:peptidyl-prolyl cis-trans isomerase D
MLAIMRKGANTGFIKIVLFGVLLFAVAGLIFMDVGGYLRKGVTQAHVATVAGENFPADMFDRDAQRIVSRQNGLDIKTAYKLGYVNQILQSEINSRVMQKEALSLGFRIGDDIVLDQINAVVSPYAQDAEGRKVAMRRLLQQQGMNENEFTNAIRTEMQSVILQNAIASATGYVPPEESADLYSYINETRTIRAFVLKDSDMKDLPASSDEVLKPFYQAAHEKYAVPETRSFTVAVLSKQDLPIAEVTDEEVHKAYEADLARYTSGETRTLDMAIMGDEASAHKVLDILNNPDSKVKMTLKEAVASVEGDTKRYAGVNDYQKDGMPEALAGPAFSAKQGQTFGPITTPLGWHIGVVKNIAGSKVQPYEEVKGEIRKELMQAADQDSLTAKADEIDNRITGGDALEDLAKEYKMQVTKLGPVRQDGSTADSKEGIKQFEKDRDTLLGAAFDQLEGESSQLIELANGDYAIVRVDGITEKTYRSFDEVKPEIAAMWDKDQQNVLNGQRAKDVVKALQAGKSLDAAAKEANASVGSYDLKRSGKPAAPLNENDLVALFETGRGDFVAVPVEGGFAVAQVTEVHQPDAAKASAKELKAVAETAKKNVQNEFNALYLDHLQRKYHVTVNKQMLDTMYGGGADGEEIN